VIFTNELIFFLHITQECLKPLIVATNSICTLIQKLTHACSMKKIKKLNIQGIFFKTSKKWIEIGGCKDKST